MGGRQQMLGNRYVQYTNICHKRCGYMLEIATGKHSVRRAKEHKT